MPKLTAEEIVDRSDELAGLEIEREQIKADWKEKASDHRKGMERLEERIMRLAREIQTGVAEDVQTEIPEVTVAFGSGPDAPISLEESSANAAGFLDGLRDGPSEEDDEQQGPSLAESVHL